MTSIWRNIIKIIWSKKFLKFQRFYRFALFRNFDLTRKWAKCFTLKNSCKWNDFTLFSCPQLQFDERNCKNSLVEKNRENFFIYRIWHVSFTSLESDSHLSPNFLIFKIVNQKLKFLPFTRQRFSQPKDLFVLIFKFLYTRTRYAVVY